MSRNIPGPQTKDAALRVFVYGTLKKGFWNHDMFCRDALYIKEAALRGQLYELPSRIPVLRVPDNDILAFGTSDPLADAITQERYLDQMAVDTICDPACREMIRGEMIVFPHPELSLPPMDRLEGFMPGCPSLYIRVLVPVVTENDVLPAWCYIDGGNLRKSIVPTRKSCWP
ncbi:MAG: gamma-glutamylcyclotransferase family protein [Armatimonadota bacterium]